MRGDNLGTVELRERDEKCGRGAGNCGQRMASSGENILEGSLDEGHLITQN